MPKFQITFSRTIREEHTATVEASSLDEIVRRLDDGDIPTTVSDSALLSETPARIIQVAAE